METGYTFEWRDGRTEEVHYVDRGYYYIFPDHTRMPIEAGPAWCHVCRKFTLCERLRTEADLRQEIAELSDPSSARWQSLNLRCQNMKEWSPNPFPIEELILIEKRILENQLRHVLIRTLPASCLSCGNRQVTFLKYGEWATHPETGQDFRVSIEGHGCGICRMSHFYDVDGHPLKLTDRERSALESL